MYITKTTTTLIAAAFSTLLSTAQPALDRYIATGLNNNLVLKEQNISLERSQLALKSAKSYFLPSLDFGASYTLAQGGRSIDLPLGDLLNGVYSTLNEVTESARFPQLENVQEQFLPNNFYDMRFRLSYPLLNPDIHYAKQISEHQIKLENHEVEIYRADLVRDIKHAYYNYAAAQTAVAIYTSALQLVERNLRNSNSLFENGSGLYASVLRAESEVENVQAQLIEARNKMSNAGIYLNFLVNRPHDMLIEFENPELSNGGLEKLSITHDPSTRPEMQQINTAMELANTHIKSKKAYVFPRINTFLDLGSQGFNFDFNEQSRYFMFGLQLDVPIFNGQRNRISIHDAQLQLASLTNQREMVEKQLTISAAIAQNNMRSTAAQLASAQKKENAAQTYFNLIDKGFAEGTNSLIEFLDARNQLTSAGLQVALSQFQLLSSQADLERELTQSQTKNL